MIVGAIDLGYGYTKYGVHLRNGKINTGTFPSLVKRVHGNRPAKMEGTTRQQLVEVSIKKSRYLLGPDIFDTDVEDARQLFHEYPRTVEYHALMLGALHYMKQKEIDMLVLGLPVSNLRLAREVAQKWKGEHQVGGRKVTVHDVKVLAQPLGGLMHRFNQEQTGSPNELHLVIDPGYFTLDWIVTRGLKVIEDRSHSYDKSMRACLTKMASYISDDAGMPFSDLKRLERHIISRQPMRVGTKTYKPADLEKTADEIIRYGIAMIREKLGGNLDDISEITLIGGGSKRYAQAVKRDLKRKPIDIKQPRFANVLGFLAFGQRLVSAKQAASKPAPEAA